MSIMSKGIAINTILMLLVGILVVGIVVYLVYKFMLSPGLSQTECRTQFVAWCTSCKASGFAGGFDLGNQLADCINKYGFCPTKDCKYDQACSEYPSKPNYYNLTACPTVGIT
jgi:hypothetical protein